MEQEQKKIFTVSELTFAIKSRLEPEFRSISVQGEVSNLKKQASGHYYFSLKDKGSQLSCALFKRDAASLSKPIQDGNELILQGEISVYMPRGGYQLIVRQVQYSGIGKLLLKLHELKEALKQRGWLNPGSKKPIPKFPKKIGVVTSGTGAVIQDILHVLKRRFSGFHLILNPVKVQGEGAAQEIASAIEQFNQHQLVDVLIVGRGGGSLEDLWPFNEEIVAKAIFESTIPVISAVGHETDTSISDLVADLRAPTPSAAAEIVSAEQEQMVRYLTQIKERITQGLKQRVVYYRQRMNDLQKQPLFSRSYALLAEKMQSFDDLQEKYHIWTQYFLVQHKQNLCSIQKQLHSFNPNLYLSRVKNTLSYLQKRLDQSIYTHFLKKKNSFNPKKLHSDLSNLLKKSLIDKKKNIKTCLDMLTAIDPKNLLQKGYTILFSKTDNSIILSSNQVKKGDLVYALMKDGKVYTQIQEIKPEVFNEQ